MHSIPTHSVRRPSGIIVVVDPDAPHETQRDTLSCVHCQTTWVVMPGSGKERGFCLKCMGPTCGPNCPVGVECRGPWEKHCERIERGGELPLIG